MILISPAKTLNESTPNHITQSTPSLLDKQQKLVKVLSQKSASQLKQLYNVSDALAQQNYQRFQAAISPEQKKEIPAIVMFKGDVYLGLQVSDWEPAHFERAQQNIRILSGLYGILRPLDSVQPYRLEMGTSLNVGTNKNLYEFWGDDVTNALNEAAENSTLPYIINLASNEYFKAVKTKLLKKPLLTIQFKEWRGDTLKVISFSAKKARGLMARYIIRNNIQTLEGIKAFNLEGYCIDDERSDESTLLFTRQQPA